MEAYTGFAEVYDIFMDEVPYEKWVASLHSLLVENGVKDGLIVDLGCGTGTVTTLLAKKGYDMIGIDSSMEMLGVAMSKNEESCHGILYLHQDMREFELYGTVKAIVSICDSINYILTQKELIDVFQLVNNYLDPSGVFIFDFNTIYKYKEVLGDTTIAENREDCSFIWENTYYEEEEINEYELSVFIREDQKWEQDIYRKYEETHLQKGYELKTIKECLKKAGLKFIEAYDAVTWKTPSDESERIYVIAKECMKSTDK